ncbi:MAG: hypothetical protein OEZ06_15310 [Myxococcales bacterium]|nr:hypothetical protein [Myxococcales bacterium]
MSVPQDERDSEPEGPFLPRWLLWVIVPGVAAPLLIFAFILLTESAHDSERCPYQQLERRELGPELWVVEEGRSCIEGVEERRYTLFRGGEARLLGRRRFAPEDFAEGRHSWTAVVSELGEVQVTVHNAGHDPALFREGTAEEREKGISY